MNAKFKENEKPLRRKTSRILHVQHTRASWNEHSQMRSRKKKLEEVLTRLLIDGVHQLQPFTNNLLCPTYFWSDDDIKTFVAPRNDVPDCFVASIRVMLQIQWYNHPWSSGDATKLFHAKRNDRFITPFDVFKYC